MPTANESTAAARQPRQRPVPSPRDQQIYLDYQAAGQRQIDLAEQYKLTQTRISQIVRRVEKWLHAPRGAGILVCQATDSAARKRLERRLEYERLNAVCRQALRHFHEPQKTVTRKTGVRGSQTIDETTERVLPPNVQCLKVVLQVNAQLSRLEQKTPLEEDQPPTDDERRAEVEAWLNERGLFAGHFGSDAIVRDLLNMLLGKPHRGFALRALADGAGQKVVRRQPYEDQPPQMPPQDGWYYPMYDANGGLVAWLSADQVAGAIHPDYPPVSRESSDSVVQEPPGPAPDSVASGSSDPAPNPENTPSTTSPSTVDPPQPPCSPALTPAFSQTPFYAPIETQSLHLPAT